MYHIQVAISHEGRTSPEVQTFETLPISIGKRSDNDVVLNEDGISRYHAQILLRGSTLFVEDNSLNGTYLHEQRVTGCTPLEEGDVIHIGKFTIAPKLCEPVVPQTAPLPPGQLLDDIILLEPVGGSSGPAVEPPPPLFDKPRDSRNVAGQAVILGPSAILVEKELTPLLDPQADPLTLSGTLHQPGPRSLADVYHLLAAQSGATAWGQPTIATIDDLELVLADATGLIERLALRGGDPSDWARWIAHEVCGHDPLSDLLLDASTIEVVINGTTSVEYLTATGRESSSRTFSCSEALLAAYHRLTGSDFCMDSPREFSHEGLSIQTIPAPFAHAGPILVVRRSPPDFVQLPNSSHPWVHYIRSALAAGASFLVQGHPMDSLSPVALALAGALPRPCTLAVIERTTTWSIEQSIALDGYVAPDTLWSCILHLRRDWLVIEELCALDLNPLRLYARHKGGGVIATQRLSPVDNPSNRDANADLFDILITVSGSSRGPFSIRTIAESRPSGEFAAIYEATESGDLVTTNEPTRL